MKLVIDIDENVFTRLFDNGTEDYGIGNDDVFTIAKSIRNGTPLPKGHGKIIAEPTEGDIAKTIGGQNDFAECIREAVKAVFDNAPTIIEADKEYEAEVITRGKCMMCGKELTEGLFFCKECGDKANSRK